MQAICLIAFAMPDGHCAQSRQAPASGGNDPRRLQPGGLLWMWSGACGSAVQRPRATQGCGVLSSVSGLRPNGCGRGAAGTARGCPVRVPQMPVCKRWARWGPPRVLFHVLGGDPWCLCVLGLLLVTGRGPGPAGEARRVMSFTPSAPDPPGTRSSQTPATAPFVPGAVAHLGETHTSPK